jgi:hypothetical protein
VIECKVQNVGFIINHNGYSFLYNGIIIASTEYIGAEFVPYPGQVPSLKIRDVWAEQGKSRLKIDIIRISFF